MNITNGGLGVHNNFDSEHRLFKPVVDEVLSGVHKRKGWNGLESPELYHNDSVAFVGLGHLPLADAEVIREHGEVRLRLPPASCKEGYHVPLVLARSCYTTVDCGAAVIVEPILTEPGGTFAAQRVDGAAMAELEDRLGRLQYKAVPWDEFYPEQAPRVASTPAPRPLRA